MEEQNNYLKIRSEYCEYPGPRYSAQGSASGEDFYHNKLNALFADTFIQKKTLVVDLDETAGYLSSFLDEAFGNLVFDFTLEIVKPRIEIVSLQESDWKKMIFGDVYRDWEKRRIDNLPPKKTEEHTAWFRFVNGELKQKVWIRKS
jgi:hypothetical protein